MRPEISCGANVILWKVVQRRRNTFHTSLCDWANLQVQRGKLCDFGTATRIGASGCLCGVMGTPGYRVPWQHTVQKCCRIWGLWWQGIKMNAGRSILERLFVVIIIIINSSTWSSISQSSITQSASPATSSTIWLEKATSLQKRTTTSSSTSSSAASSAATTTLSSSATTSSFSYQQQH